MIRETLSDRRNRGCEWLSKIGIFLRSLKSMNVAIYAIFRFETPRLASAWIPSETRVLFA